MQLRCSPAIPRIPELRSLDAERESLTAAEIGTAMHYIMEKVDFSRALAEGKPYVEQLVEELHEKRRAR